MRLTYTLHARDQMIARDVSEAEVEAIVAEPDITHADRQGNPTYTRTLNNRRIRVVVALESDPPRIITVIVLG